MRKIGRLCVVLIVGLFLAGCSIMPKGATWTNPLARSHFGVPDKALTVPAEFDQTAVAIANAEKSEGAKYCPEKITQANALGKKAAETYWACRDAEAKALFAQAVKLANEATTCKPPVKVSVPSAPALVPAPATGSAATPLSQAISVHSVYFDFNKSNLKPEAKVELDKAIKSLKNNPNTRLELQGNTDSIGSKAANKALGNKRAVAVFNYLKANGITTDRLRVVSLGELNPIADNKTEVGRAKNRRVDLVTLKVVPVTKTDDVKKTPDKKKSDKKEPKKSAKTKAAK